MISSEFFGSDRARFRNECVAAIAREVLIAYAEKGSETEKLAREAIAWGKPLLILDDPHNASLTQIGAKVLEVPL